MAKKPGKKKPRKDAGGPAPSAKKVVSKTGREIRGIVRVAGRDLKGEYPLRRALVRVRGVGERYAAVIAEVAARELKVPLDIYVGELTEEHITKLENILSNPSKYEVPSWITNRQKDIEAGVDKHMIGTDLGFAIKQDVEREKKMNTWIGYRHNYGQKVRGQRTRTTGRKGITVGVLRKAVLAKQGPAAAAGEKKEKKEEKKEKKE
jgi:small subunit ribosomal protein S13